MDDEKNYVFQFGDFKTLPLYHLRGRLLEDLHSLSQAKMEIEYIDPDYTPPKYKPTAELLNEIGRNPEIAIQAIKSWNNHLSNYSYYVQFKDDAERELTASLRDHTETLSILCDSRLKLDPTPLWKAFDHVFLFTNIQEEYRKDPNKKETWSHHANRLKKLQDRESNDTSSYLIQRMIKQVELQQGRWQTFPAIHCAIPKHALPINLFYSYSHKDENLFNQLRAHLSLLTREIDIFTWHDRRISSGSEWKGQIDEHLNGANIILLLVSAHFIASEYCFDIEMKLAMERHENGEALVIPIILRHCDWQSAPFGKLQAVPKDGRPITSWKDKDKAFADVSKSIRRAIEQFSNNQ